MDGRRSLMMAKRSSTQVANVGDIAYKATDGSIKVVAPDAWSTSLGTPIGVVVIPSGFAPDNGLTRIVSLYYTTKTHWGNSGKDSPLANQIVVPTTDNKSAALSGNNISGYLPSDLFTGAISYTDPEAKYYGLTPYIPSPYLGNTPNPAYYAEIFAEGMFGSGGSALTDFDGKGNTTVIVGFAGTIGAAYAAKNYKVTGAEDIEWYLPAMGELGYMMVRINKIAATIEKIGAEQLSFNSHHWSSTEYDWNNAYTLITSAGEVNVYSKTYGLDVRPFAMLDF